jgi:hypothetical protein
VTFKGISQRCRRTVSKRMSIDRLDKLLRRWRRVKAPRGKFKHCHNRFPRQVDHSMISSIVAPA